MSSPRVWRPFAGCPVMAFPNAFLSVDGAWIVPLLPATFRHHHTPTSPDVQAQHGSDKALRHRQNLQSAAGKSGSDPLPCNWNQRSGIENLRPHSVPTPHESLWATKSLEFLREPLPLVPRSGCGWIPQPDKEKSFRRQSCRFLRLSRLLPLPGQPSGRERPFQF